MDQLTPPDQLLDLLYTATTDFAIWPDFMEHFAKHFNATAASYDKVRQGEGESRFSAVYGLNPDDLDWMMQQQITDPRDEVAYRFPGKPFLLSDTGVPTFNQINSIGY